MNAAVCRFPCHTRRSWRNAIARVYRPARSSSRETHPKPRPFAGLAGAISLLAANAAANDVADFCKDKTLTIVVGNEVGTGFGI